MAGDVGAGAWLGCGLVVLLLLHVGLSSLQHGGWAPREQGPREQALLVTGIFLTQPWTLHSVRSTTACGSPRDLPRVYGRVMETHHDLMRGVSGSQANLSIRDQR